MSIKKFSEYSLIVEAKKDTSDFKYIRDLGGTVGAYLYQDSKGDKWVVKYGKDTNHMWNEYTANKVYAKFGVKVPESYIGELDGKKVMITKYLEGSIPLGDMMSIKNVHNKVSKHFLFDILTANWDVVGLNDDLDNIRVKDGDVYRVDLGGALLYRAQGKRKGGAFSSVPTEQETLKDEELNFNASKVFGKISDEDLQDQIRYSLQKYVLDTKINYRSFLRDLRLAIYDEDNGMSDTDKKEIYSKLAHRAFYLYKFFNK